MGLNTNEVIAARNPLTEEIEFSTFGASFAPAAAAAGLVRTVTIGDSQTRNLQVNSIATSATRSGNVATITVTGHILTSGQDIDVYNMADSTFNAFGAIGTKVDANTITYPSIGPDGSTTSLSASSAMSMAYPGYRDLGYFPWLNSLARGAMTLVRNAGSNGQDAAAMLARFDADVSSIAHDHLIIWTGSNDFALPAVTRTAAAVYADVKAMIAKSTARRITVVSATPYGTGSPAWNTAGRLEALKYNRMMRQYCNVSKRVRFADATPSLIDATNATAFFPIANVVGTDALHLTPYGQYLIAQAIYNVNADWLPLVYRLVSSNKDNYGADTGSINIHDVGPWTNTGGALGGTTTGTVSAGLGVTGTTTGGGSCAASVVARSDAIGYDQVADVVFGAASDTVLIGGQGYTTINTGRANAGDRLKFLGELTLTTVSGSNLKGVDIGIKFNTSPSTTVNVFGSGAANAAGFPQIDQAVFLESPEIVVPVGATGYTLQATARASAAGTSVRVKLGRMSMDNLSKFTL